MLLQLLKCLQPLPALRCKTAGQLLLAVAAIPGAVSHVQTHCWSLLAKHSHATRSILASGEQFGANQRGPEGLSVTRVLVIVAIFIVIGLLVGVLLGCCIWRSRPQAGAAAAGSAPTPAAEAQLLKAEVDLPTSEVPLISESPDSGDVKADQDRIDYERLFLLVAQRAAQTVGPKVAKGQAIRNTIMGQLSNLRSKTKTFFFNEFNFTAGALLKAAEMEEAAIIFDWNNQVSSNLPAASVLLAGALSPTLLSIRQALHLFLLLLGPLPILLLCIWAIVYDWGKKCAIPSIFAWSWTQGALGLLLSVGHLMMFLKIRSGLKTLAAKSEELNEKLKASEATSTEDGDMSGMREFFVAGSMLLQQALLVEDNMRRSFWTNLTGVSSLLWIATMFWDYVLVIGWTFWPGIIAFHPKAEKVAPDAFCGAHVTVFVARFCCVLHLIFLLVTLVATVSWLSDVFVNSPSYGRSLLKAAEKADEGMLGVPIAQTLVKAFVLRGGADMASTQLSLSLQDKSQLERQRQEIQKQVDDLSKQITVCYTEEVTLKRASGIAEPECVSDGMDAAAEKDLDQVMGAMQGQVAALEQATAKEPEAMQGQAVALEQATAKELEAMMKKITELVNAVQDADTYKSAVSQAQAAADATAQRASEAAAQLNTENLQSALAQAQEAAAQLNTENLQSALVQAQEAAEVGMQRAKEAAGQLQSENLQGTMAQAAEAGRCAAEQLQRSAQSIGDTARASPPN